jgi:hypothetical protein
MATDPSSARVGVVSARAITPPASLGGVPAAQKPPPTEPSDLQGPTGATATDAGFGYQGGPIIANPQVHASFWGASWSDAAHAARRSDLIQFVQDFLASDYMNILSQYGVGNGAGRCGTWIGATDLPTASGQMTDVDIHTSIQSMINAGDLPEPGTPSSVALLIFLDESIEINDSGMGIVMCEPQGDTAFGYHFFFTTGAGHKFYYSVIPALDDNCLRESCPDDSSCSLHLAETQEQRQTQVASHEFSEMVSDPEISAWRDPHTGAENGDNCNGQSGTITVSGRSWTVQLMYSKTDDENGGPACILNPSNPIPSLFGPYKTRILETGTTFAPETDGTWLMADYDRDGIPDLVFIKTSNTGTGTVEVHVASGASNYQTRILETGTTFAPETDGTWLMADYDRDGIPDLVFIKTSNTGTGTVEVHIAD